MNHLKSIALAGFLSLALQAPPTFAGQELEEKGVKQSVAEAIAGQRIEATREYLKTFEQIKEELFALEDRALFLYPLPNAAARYHYRELERAERDLNRRFAAQARAAANAAAAAARPRRVAAAVAPAPAPVATAVNVASMLMLSPDSLSMMRQNVARTAQRYLGTRYRWGGISANGLDCSGFVYRVYADLGIAISRDGQSQASIGESVPLEQVRTGDLLAFGRRTGRGGFWATHLALVLSNQDGVIRFIHATRRGAIIDQVGNSAWGNYYASRFLSARRFLKVTPGSQVTEQSIQTVIENLAPAPEVAPVEDFDFSGDEPY